MSLFTLYLITTILPNIDEMFTIAFVVSILIAGFVAIGCALTFIADDKPQNKVCAKVLKKIMWVLIPLALINVFLPSSQQIYTIMGGSIVTNIEGIEKLPPNLINAANDFLESVQRKEAKQEE